MNVYFYNNTKRHNSTALPPTYTEYRDCKFKNPTSLLEPVLIVAFNTKPYYNYFSIDNRYYWITDIVSLKEDLWEISGKVDVLATYRRHIQNTRAFVLFDSTSNTQLPDNRLAIQTDCDAHTATAAMPWSFNTGTGTYLVCTTGNCDEVDLYTGSITSNSREGTGVYIIPKNQLDNLGFDGSDLTTAILSSYNAWNSQMNTALNNALAGDPVNDPFGWLGGWLQFIGIGFWSGIAAGLDFFKIIGSQLIGGGSALSNIKAAYWLPFVIPNAASVATSKPLALGSYEDNISGLRRVDDPVITSAWVSVNIPWQYSDWRNVSCTEVSLYIPLIGCINIPSEVVKGNSQLQVRIALNLYSGSMACEVRCDSADLGTYGANVAMPYLIGDSNMNVGGIVNTITSAASSNYVGVALGAAQSLTPMATSVGGIGGGAGTGLTDTIVCTCRVHNTSQNPSALLSTIGTPTNQLKQLNGSGYCQCMNAQMNNVLAGEMTPHTILNQVIATFNTNTAQPYDALIVDINAVQEEGTPTPATPCVISGFNNAQIDNNNVITTIDFGSAGTVYGGTLNVKTGLLTVTGAYADLGDGNWYADPNRAGVFYCPSMQTTLKSTGYIKAECFSELQSGVVTNVDNYISSYSSYGNGYFFIRCTDFSGYTGAQVKAALTGLKFVYELKTPLTYTVSGVSLNSIVGSNRVSALTNGNVNTLTYYTISTPEADPTETEILLVNDALNSGVYLE